jgi:hypothetical protein
VGAGLLVRGVGWFDEGKRRGCIPIGRLCGAGQEGWLELRPEATRQVWLEDVEDSLGTLRVSLLQRISDDEFAGVFEDA